MTDAVLDLAYVIALAVTLWGTAIALGLANDPAEVVAASARRRALFVRIVALNVVVFPLVVAGLVAVLRIPDGYAAGLVLVGAAAAGPIGLLVSRIGRADVPLAIGLVLVLEAANLATIPAWSTIMLDEASQPPIVQVVATLVAAILVPLALGFAGRARWPDRAMRWSAWLGRVAVVGLGAVIAIVLIRDTDEIIDAWAALVPAAAAVAVLAGLATGWIVGGPDAGARATGAIVTATRASSPALAVASAAYGASSDAAVAIVAFALVSLAIVPPVGALLGAMAARSGSGRRGPARARTT